VVIVGYHRNNPQKESQMKKRLFGQPLILALLLAGMLGGCPQAEDCNPGSGDEDNDGAADCADDECFNVAICAACGNNIVEGAEVCDGNAFDGQSCATQGFETGVLACSADCSALVTAGCSDLCGNGSINNNEQCDGAALGGQDCTDQGFGGGTLDCNDECTFDTSRCEGGSDCGDGINQAGEECDDGNNINGDGCEANCTFAPDDCSHDVCTTGEALVNGCNSCVAAVCAADDFCCDAINGSWDTLCVEEVFQECGISCATNCGDGFLNGGEECDDGNNINGDGCDATCQIEFVGEEGICNDLEDDDQDGLFDCQDPDCQALGVCTPGAGLAGEPCTSASDCAANNNDPFCIEEAQFDFPLGYCSEFCDVNAPICSGDAICSDIGLGPTAGLCLDSCAVNADCRAGYTCQDALLTGEFVCFLGEETICDDGLDDEQDGLIDCADNDCSINPICSICGDGVISAGEQCDDGNIVDGDTCSSVCLLEGVIQEVEPNNTSAEVTALGAPDTIGAGSIVGSDVDFFSVDLTAGTIIKFQTSDLSGLTSCNNIDTILTLFDIDGASFIDTDDDGAGVGTCSLITFAVPVSGTYFIQVSSFGGSDVPAYLLFVTDEIVICGDGIFEAGEECDDGNTVDGDGCDATCQIEFLPESICNDLIDDDQDGLFDCQDPDCQALGVCTPGAGLAGEPCTSASDCTANNNDPFCIDEAQFDFLLGSCSEFCDVNAPICSGDAICSDIGLGPTAGLCFDACAVNADCRAGYTCQDALLTGEFVCFPGEETICDDGLDDEQDGLIDCADNDCALSVACAVCGDGIVQGGEQCDDGGVVAGDGCDATCQAELTDCAHDICVEGVPLDANGCFAPNDPAGTCAALVCAADSFCCGAFGGTWDDLCVDEVLDFCNIACP
jgi:cysteine-rich repeat protein